MLFEVLAALVLGIITLWFYVFLQKYRHLKDIPGPQVWPIIGNAYALKNPGEIMFRFPQLMKEHKSETLRMQFGFRSVLVSADYNLIERVLSSSTLIYKRYYQFISWVGQGLFTSSGEKWRKSRKIITPTFHFKILEQFLDVFNLNGDILIQKLHKRVGNTSVDIFPMMTLCTLDIICETAMGISVNVQSDDTSEYAQYVDKITDIVHKRAFTPLYNIDFIYRMTKMYRHEQALLKFLHGRTDSVIKLRRKKLEEEAANGGQSMDKVDEFGRKKKVPFLDMLLQSTIDGRPLNDSELRDEVSTFMFAGHDTTSGAMSFTLFAIANHPEVQKKAYEEIFSIFGDDKKRHSTPDDIQQMKYLELVIKESLRIYPTAPVFGRIITENCEYNGTIIPPGTGILFLPHTIHHNPQYFPNPEKFDPERFAPQNFDGKKPYCYIPFSAGPRNCVGQKYAMMEMKCIISLILRNFELRPAMPEHKLQLRSLVTLKSANGIKIAFAGRKH